MIHLTLRLPETLHEQLETLARDEAISLNQYIVYALTRQVTLAYTVQPVAEAQIKEQQAAYGALLQGLGAASFAQVEKTLAGRARPAGEAPDAGSGQSLENAAGRAEAGRLKAFAVRPRHFIIRAAGRLAGALIYKETKYADHIRHA
jgi:hypothetical protein